VSMMEMILLAPVFMALFMLVVLCGRVVNARGIVDGAARDGARAASIARSNSDATSAAVQATTTDLAAMAPVKCKSVNTATSGWAPGGIVTVTVTCTISLADLSLLKVPGQVPITVTHRAPVDFFRGT
jgi:Flp pilus assembly protein TadG